MMQLKGLLMREWLRMKHWLVALLVAVTIILSAGPQVLMGIFGQGDDTATIGFMTGLMLLPGISWPFSLAVIIGYMVIFMALSYMTFMKRDVMA
ncbi:hypothetical protein [Lacicoccus alkaliphilus]|uniref:Uncharacterized protein n=1 Tax=Lacicoccus alkaliphilus DSM 16010 TaxID=1123231 RepID=A0A1M7ITI9_9BACL|nr:hypothetical protein [Salinicoccus alkaliphilus]SHM44009.1 hypothetical protein SAMN02745189_02153 [Salinicoccus alkaliphilus DSM 16010]